MIFEPCPACFVNNIGVMPIAIFNPVVQGFCAPLAALSRDNRAEDDAYIVLACPVCNQEMDDSPLRLGLGNHVLDEVEVIFTPEWDEDEKAA
jgi:hypothetical protein